MSTPERARHRRRWPISPINVALLAFCAVATAVAYSLGQNVMGTAFLLGGILGGAGAAFARRRNAGDLERVNALEYADERERAVGTKGLAAVGVVALILAAVQLLVHAFVATDPLSRWMSFGLFCSVNLTWIIANWFFVRRG